MIKRHPFCNSQHIEITLRNLTKSNPYVQEVKGSIYPLIRSAHAIIGVNSGVTLEALFYDKPVFCAGLSEWYAATNPVQTVRDIIPAFNPTPSRMNSFQKKLIAYLVTEYWVNITDPPAISQKITKCMALFDPNYGYDDEKMNPADILVPIIQNIQAKLEISNRLSKALTVDNQAIKQENHAIKQENLTIKKELSRPFYKRTVRKIKKYFKESEQ